MSLHKLLFIGFLLSSTLLAEEKCPPINLIQEQLLTRFQTQLKLKAALEDLLIGSPNTEMPLTLLFTVDLNDQTQISSRINELKTYDSNQKQTLIVCAEFHKDLKNHSIQVTQLENEVNNLRIQFLTLPLEKRQALINLQEQTSTYNNNIKKLMIEEEKAKGRAEVADLSLKNAEESVLNKDNDELKLLASKRIILEKMRKIIADQVVFLTEELKSLSLKSKGYSQNLSEGASYLSAKETPNIKLHEAYTRATLVWRSLLDDLFNQKFSIKIAIPSLPQITNNLKDLKPSQIEENEYLESFNLAIQERSEAISLKNKLQSETQHNYFKLIILAGKIRSQFIAELKDKSEINIFKLNNENFSDLYREIRLIPYRPLVIAKNLINDISDHIAVGLSGWLILFKQFLVLLLFIVVPFLSYWLMQKATHKLETLRNWLITNGRISSYYHRIAYWIYALNPYLPWCILFIAIQSSQIVIQGTELENLSELLPYFQYYIWYKIFRIALKQSALVLSEHNYSDETHKLISDKIQRTGKVVGLFFLISAYILEATSAATREALFYHLVSNLVFIISPLILAIAASWWSEEIKANILNIFPHFIASRLSKYLSGKFKFFFSLPILILLILGTAVKRIYSYAVRMDSAKRVSAQLFKRKLESTARQNNLDIQDENLTDAYLDFFGLGPPQNNDLMVYPENIPYEAIATIIDSWIKGETDEHTMAIQGEKGIGKSTTIQFLRNKFSNINIISVSITQKIITEVDLLNFLAPILSSTSIQGITDILEIDKKINKTLIFIDEGQNFFLGKRGGFAAFHSLSSIFNLRTQNLLWCISFNKYSWTYLNAVTGGSQFFRKTYAIDSWSDANIRNLIMSRHNKTNFRLEFDPILYATGQALKDNEFKYIQERFFEMLWDQSRGNPRTALKLWLSSLKQINQTTVKVGIPKTPPTRPLDGLTDEEFFVIAAIVRHENLTVAEAMEVCNLSEIVVRHSMRVGLEREFLVRTDHDGRYRVQSLWQASLTSQLVSKNFIYE